MSRTPKARHTLPLAAHALALMMPFTMTVLIPWLLLTNYAHTSALPLQAVGGLCMVAGITLFCITLKLFVVVGNGTLAPWSPTQKLVVIGPYRYCRNPMISSVLAVILGEAFFFGSTVILMWAGLFFAVNTVYFVLSEEPGLLTRFGEQYVAYKKVVPRWIPTTKPFQT